MFVFALTGRGVLSVDHDECMEMETAATLIQCLHLFCSILFAHWKMFLQMTNHFKWEHKLTSKTQNILRTFNHHLDAIPKFHFKKGSCCLGFPDGVKKSGFLICEVTLFGNKNPWVSPVAKFYQESKSPMQHVSIVLLWESNYFKLLWLNCISIYYILKRQQTIRFNMRK